MSRHRAALLSRCTLTDRNCLAFVRDAQHVDTIEWPRVGYACDFCDTWPRRVGRCQQCRRWTGLSDCDCSADASSNMTQLVAGDTQAVAPDDDTDAVCRWCASGETASAPAPCGRTFGLLRRVVFVLEPKEGGRWQFRVAQRLAEAVLEAVGCGTVLFYGLESGADELEWQRAMSAVRRFAAAPLAHLPPHCVLDPDTPLRVSVVLATHSMQRLSDGDALRLELADGESRVLQWWVRHLGHDMLAAQRAPAVPATRISELYLISCHLFPRGATAAAANARALGALADQYGVSVMACDGEPPMFQQIALLASYIVASSASASQRRREPTLACRLRRFQPLAPTLVIEPQPARLVVEAYHETAIEALVAQLARAPATVDATPPGRAVAARRRALLQCADVALCQAVVCDQWPFARRGGGVQWSVAQFARAFECAAAARGLLLTANASTTYNQLVDWIAGCSPIDGRARSSIQRQLSFLVRRLARDGVLDTHPASSVRWSLERAILTGVVAPPSVHFLWHELDVGLFDTALTALDRAWSQAAVVQRKSHKRRRLHLN